VSEISAEMSGWGLDKLVRTRVSFLDVASLAFATSGTDFQEFEVASL
jgi:hypothetical protein